jgi:hypothetical protein
MVQSAVGRTTQMSEGLRDYVACILMVESIGGKTSPVDSGKNPKWIQVW